MTQRLLSVALAVVAVPLLAIHVTAKRRPDPKELGRIVSSMGENGRWTGKVSPDFELALLEGGSFHLADHVGREVILLNFFATWCGPCKAEMPELGRLTKRMHGRPFVILAVNAQENADVVQSYVHEAGLTLPVAIDESGDVLKSFGVDSFPTTVVIGPAGTILLYETGAVLNADVAFEQPLHFALADIAAGKGTSRDAYLDAVRGSHGTTMPSRETARAARIAASMRCPCGCEDTVAACRCATAKGIRARLDSDSFGGQDDAEVMRHLDREFCIGHGKTHE